MATKAKAAMTTGIGRIPITSVSPKVDGGRFPVKAVVGERVRVHATSFREGHDQMGVQLLVTNPEGDTVRSPMTCTNPGLDHWEGSFRPDREGEWSYRVEAFDAPYLTWAHNAEVKIAAGVDEELMCAEGVIVLKAALAEIPKKKRPKTHRARLEAAIDALTNTSLQPSARIAPALAADMHEAMTEYPLRRWPTRSAKIAVRVERERALYGSWYEFFPRSEGAHFDPEQGGWTSGTLESSLPQLDRIKRMGFDVAYLTPIHPIGTTHRKGRNNTLTALEGDPGSPYAIGSPDGGHDAIHPDLGTIEDFDRFVAHAKSLGLEVALDIALQCSPDHPWVKEHPEWFVVRADGTIAYAENPPKKYQDIYPLSFDTDYRGLYEAIRDVLEYWISHGVTLFRVDNPHTKPVRFWEELLAEFRETHPEVLFLAEAFTKPAMMHTLAKVGYHQSYTYFAWRHSPEELREYMEELKAAAHYMRPSFWPTTHDILTPFMSDGGWNAFRLRAILAATLSPTWGIYSGFELVEHQPRPGAQENIDNEKYEYKPRDYEGALRSGRSLEPLLTRLNEIRKAHPALQTLTTTRFHGSDDDRVLVFSKHVEGRDTDSGLDDTIIVVSMTEAHGGTSTWVHLDTEALNIHSDFMVEDLLTGEQFLWDRDSYVELSADFRPAHILRVIRY